MNENEIYVVNEYDFDNPHRTKIDTIIDRCYTDCHNKYFHNFKYVNMILNLQKSLKLKQSI